jgi:hypothetical protein
MQWCTTCIVGRWDEQHAYGIWGVTVEYQQQNVASHTCGNRIQLQRSRWCVCGRVCGIDVSGWREEQCGGVYIYALQEVVLEICVSGIEHSCRQLRLSTCCGVLLGNALLGSPARHLHRQWLPAVLCHAAAFSSFWLHAAPILCLGYVAAWPLTALL